MLSIRIVASPLQRLTSIPEINRPSRQEVDSPRSINTGDRLEGVNYSERSQSSEARVSRLKTSKKDSHRRHSDIRDTQHRSRDYDTISLVARGKVDLAISTHMMIGDVAIVLLTVTTTVEKWMTTLMATGILALTTREEDTIT